MQAYRRRAARRLTSSLGCLAPRNGPQREHQEKQNAVAQEVLDGMERLKGAYKAAQREAREVGCGEKDEGGLSGNKGSQAAAAVHACAHTGSRAGLGVTHARLNRALRQL